MKCMKAYHQLVLLRLGRPEWNISHVIDWFEYVREIDEVDAKQKIIRSRLLYKF